ncbi:hypothetical protein BDZ91DRAFT_133291 [Kalaharituber pfeilii]|nr:hypothetical protein BDZ91DRAFT_133291 [Kalaharituber pfeilii]
MSPEFWFAPRRHLNLSLTPISTPVLALRNPRLSSPTRLLTRCAQSACFSLDLCLLYYFKDWTRNYSLRSETGITKINQLDNKRNDGRSDFCSASARSCSHSHPHRTLRSHQHRRSVVVTNNIPLHPPAYRLVRQSAEVSKQGKAQTTGQARQTYAGLVYTHTVLSLTSVLEAQSV